MPQPVQSSHAALGLDSERPRSTFAWSMQTNALADEAQFAENPRVARKSGTFRIDSRRSRA